MSVIERWEPTQAMIDAATPHVEAARRTTMHAGHHARAALIDAAAANDRLTGAVKAFDHWKADPFDAERGRQLEAAIDALRGQSA